MLDYTLAINFIIALALGALVGLEREYARYKKKARDFAGIRTFPMIALFGAISAYLSIHYSLWIFVVAFLIMGAFVIAAYYTIAGKLSYHMGATSEIAALITFLVGALAIYGEVTLASIVTVVITTILYLKAALHQFAKKIKTSEIQDTLKFAIIAIVILPLLPNQGFGPHEIFNPFVIWLMVVFISGISFVGYIFMKWFGEKGISIAGILGGLVSSTAVTTSFAQRSKKEKKIYQALVLGVILANAIMFIRILIEVFVINQELFPKLLIPMLTLAVICAIFSFFLYEKSKNVKGKIDLGSPFTLGPALKFGVFFAVILALVKLADVYLSTKGVYIVSVISGFADVDAITVSLSQLAKTSLDHVTARNGIVIAALTNVAVKGGIAFWFGGKKFGRIILSFYSALIVVGIVTIVFL
jgi:uncharacterized membrane protein (DUF4010 family)